MATVLTEGGEVTVAATSGLWLSADEVERATGWTLKPEGMCQHDVCVPLPVRDGRVDVAAFWRLLDRPVVSDAAGATWVLGSGASVRIVRSIRRKWSVDPAFSGGRTMRPASSIHTACGTFTMP